MKLKIPGAKSMRRLFKLMLIGRERSLSMKRTTLGTAPWPEWGRDKTQRYMRALARQDIQLRNGQTLIAQLMAAGEFSVAIVLAHRMKKIKKQKGT
jgi:hypothetical protein